MISLLFFVKYSKLKLEDLQFLKYKIWRIVLLSIRLVISYNMSSFIWIEYIQIVLSQINSQVKWWMCRIEWRFYHTCQQANLVRPSLAWPSLQAKTGYLCFWPGLLMGWDNPIPSHPIRSPDFWLFKLITFCILTV